VISTLHAQEIIVEETRHLYGSPEEAYFFPSYSADGTSLLFTQKAYSGLWSLNRSNLNLEQITDVQGAGYHPISLSDGSIVFRQDEYLRGRKYTALYKSHNQSTQLILNGTRFLSPGTKVEDKIISLAGRAPIIIDGISTKIEKSNSTTIALTNDQLALILLRNNKLETIKPLGDGNYIWGMLSPANDQIVFTKTGRGTYISNLAGKQLVELGSAHAPQWSPDGRFIVYMKDLDDGNQYTESEIWITTADGRKTWKITNTSNRIEMYPQWSPDGKHISYHTLAGEIFETTLQITD